MTRHVRLTWPDPRPFAGRGGAPIRILGVSDEVDPGLVDRRTRANLGPVDVIVGCGDLNAAELAFVADGVDAPLVYVLGNHDGPGWLDAAAELPSPMLPTSCQHEAGLTIAALPWPAERGRRAIRSETGAWTQSLRLALRRIGRSGPLIVASHVPPRGVGDVTTDAYHVGFRGYRWLLERLQPPLWLHGHTPLAAVTDFQVRHGRTTLVNVTGAVLIELCPPERDA